MAYKDPEKQREYHRNYMRRRYANNPDAYAAHKELTKVNRNKTRDRLRAWISAYLDEHPCVDCGESDRIVLEFDHISNDKLANVADMVGQARPLQAVIAEVAKCQVRCANCHRRLTYQRARATIDSTR